MAQLLLSKKAQAKHRPNEARIASSVLDCIGSDELPSAHICGQPPRDDARELARITPYPRLRASCLLKSPLRKAFFLTDVVDNLQHPFTVRAVLYTEFRDLGADRAGPDQRLWKTRP